MAKSRKKRLDSESDRKIVRSADLIVDFKRPPVSEVLFGTGFEKAAGFSTPQMGLFWSTLHKDFPLASDAEPLPPPPPPQLPADANMISLGQTLSPRFMMRREDGSEILQIQDCWFLYNWVRTAGNTYPHYKKILGRFDEYRSKFESFLASIGLRPPSPWQLRLTYVNHIPKEHPWKTLADIGEIFPDLSYRKAGRYLRPPVALGHSAHFPVDDQNSRLEVSIRHGRLPTPTAGHRGEVVVLELTVVGRPSAQNPIPMTEWFDMARTIIVRSFLDLTDKKVQKEIWGLVDRK